MLFNEDKPLHRAQVVAHVFKDKEIEGELKIHVFDVMRHNDRDLTGEPLKERIQILFQNYSIHSDEILAFPSKKDTRIADSLKDVETYSKEIMKIHSINVKSCLKKIIGKLFKMYLRRIIVMFPC